MTERVRLTEEEKSAIQEPAPAPIHELTAQDMSEICEYRSIDIRREIRDLQIWKANSLEIVGALTVR